MSSIRARVARLAPVGVALAAVLALSACNGGSKSSSSSPTTGGASLPDGAGLLKQSSTAMTKVTSLAFTIATDGDTGLSITSANGQLLKNGDATGNAQVSEMGMAIQVDFTIVGDSFYLKGPTGGYSKQPKAKVTSIYDPSAILDPNRGVPLLLDQATNAKTVGEENIGGEDAYKVQATLPKAALAALLPGEKQDLTGDVWIGAKDHLLLKVVGAVPAANGGGGGTVTATFSQFNKAFTIKAPE